MTERFSKPDKIKDHPSEHTQASRFEDILVQLSLLEMKRGVLKLQEKWGK